MKPSQYIFGKIQQIKLIQQEHVFGKLSRFNCSLKMAFPILEC